MFVDYLQIKSPLPRFLTSTAMLACVTALNIAGVDTVANVSTIFTLLVVSPFAALVLMGLPTLDPTSWCIGPPAPSWGAAGAGSNSSGSSGSIEGGGGGVRWGTFLSVLLWNTSGYDSVGALASEVSPAISRNLS